MIYFLKKKIYSKISNTIIKRGLKFMCKKYFYLLLIFIVSISSYSNTLYQFEKGIPSNFITGKNSKIEITKEKFKDGTSSLKWNFKKVFLIILLQIRTLKLKLQKKNLKMELHH